MNRQQLCIRYGWTFSSDMPDVYISRAGVENAELDRQFANSDMQSVHNALSDAQQHDKMQRARIEQLENTLVKLQERFDEIVDALKSD